MSNNTIENINRGNFSKSFQGTVEKVSQPKVWTGTAAVALLGSVTTAAVAFAVPAAAMACFTAAIVLAVSALVFATIAGVIWAVQHYKNAGDDGQSRIHEKQPNDSGGATFSEQAMGAENGAHITRDQHQSENVDGGTPFVLKPQPQPHTPTENGGVPWKGPMSEEEQKFYEGLTSEEQKFFSALSSAGKKIYQDLRESKDGYWRLYMFLRKHKGWKNLENNEMRRIVEELPQKFYYINTNDLEAIGFDENSPLDLSKCKKLQRLRVTEIGVVTNLDKVSNLERIYIDPANDDVQGIREFLLTVKNGKKIVLQSSLEQFQFQPNEIKTIIDHGNKIIFLKLCYSDEEFMNALFGSAKEGSEDTDRVRIRTGEDGKKYKFYLNNNHLNVKEVTE